MIIIINEMSLFHSIKIHKSQMLQIYDVDKKTRQKV